MNLDSMNGPLGKPLSLVGMVILVSIFLVAVFANFLAPVDPYKQNWPQALQPPSSAHSLGTDVYGRDILSRVIYGCRTSLLVGLAAVLIGGGLGTPIGLVTAFFGGKLDAFIMRIMDAMLAFPSVILALAVQASLGPGLENAIIAIGFVSLPEYVRVMRSSMLAAKERPYVEAARAVGVSDRDMIFRHILPNCLGPTIVQSTVNIGSAILIGASFSFLGLGAQPPTADWGADIALAVPMLREAPWASFFPGFAIMMTVLGFNLVGDAVLDALNPRLRK
jgi:ABC-type dipeptide/oligopeptide/nickel transport system permease subunit